MNTKSYPHFEHLTITIICDTIYISMIKRIYKTEDILDKVVNAVDTINNPVRQTLSPKGGNVVYEDDSLNQHFTNDGFTIVNSIQVKDPVENAIIEIIKGGSRKTNLEAGDGTSSTVVMSAVLIKEGLKLISNGHNQMDVRDELNKFSEDMKEELKKRVTKVKDDKDIKFIAKISANNDDKIANDVVKVIKIVGEEGHVLIETGYNQDTEIIEDAGFIIQSGVFAEELANKQMQVTMLDVPVFITDKRLYYKSEAETILSTVQNAGYSEVVIVAQDFIGEALPYFIANHINNKIRVILIQEKKLEILEDLAAYLDGEVVSDKKGMLANNITIENFAISKKVFSDPRKSIIARDKKEVNKNLDKRVKNLRSELNRISNRQDIEYKKIEKRISSLTVGMVTLKVGGTTPLDVFERGHRYEDAINACRCALREGYLPGAGVAVYRAFKNIKVKSEYLNMFTKASEINIRQIAENCGKTPEIILNKIDEKNYFKGFAGGNYGYNAVKDKIEDVVHVGIIEPLMVTAQVIANAVSIANIILTSRYLIVNDIEDYKDNKK